MIDTLTCSVPACARKFVYKGGGSVKHPKPLCARCYSRVKRELPPVTEENSERMREPVGCWFNVPRALRDALEARAGGPRRLSAFIRRIMARYVADEALRANTEARLGLAMDLAACLRAANTALRTPPPQEWDPDRAERLLAEYDRLFDARARCLLASEESE